LCKIEFDLDEPAFVTVNVVNVMGALVETVLSEQKPAGHYNLDFDDGKLIPGKYYYKVFINKPASENGNSSKLLKTGHVSINNGA